MNPFAQQIIGAIIRTAVVWLAAKFGAEVSDDQVTSFVAQATPIVLVLAWSLWQKYHGRQKLLTALSRSRGMTENEIEREVSAGYAPTVTTPKTSIPAA